MAIDWNSTTIPKNHQLKLNSFCERKKKKCWFNNHLWGCAFNFRYVFLCDCSSVCVYVCGFRFIVVIFIVLQQQQELSVAVVIFIKSFFIACLAIRDYSRCTRCTRNSAVIFAFYARCLFFLYTTIDFILTFNLLKILAWKLVESRYIRKVIYICIFIYCIIAQRKRIRWCTAADGAGCCLPFFISFSHSPKRVRQPIYCSNNIFSTLIRSL